MIDVTRKIADPTIMLKLDMLFGLKEGDMSVQSLTYQDSVNQFLAQKRIAICGLSRTTDSGAGAIYLKLRDKGYEVIPIHPEAESLHGDTCYPNLSAIPGTVDAVFIMNSPDVTEGIVYEAAKLGIQNVWMHDNTLMPSSVSKDASAHAKSQGINVIDVGCPMMFVEPDIFHKCMKWVIKVKGRTN